jgi:hypothetical protein
MSSRKASKIQAERHIGAPEVQDSQSAAHKAIADVHAGHQVVCTIEEYYVTVRLALQRYAVAQAAQGHPHLLARAMTEIQRLDAAQAQGWWPGTYRSVWERLWIKVGRRHATRWLGLHYYRRAQRLSAALTAQRPGN